MLLDENAESSSDEDYSPPPRSESSLSDELGSEYDYDEEDSQEEEKTQHKPIVQE
jgi:hypothetical protein